MFLVLENEVDLGYRYLVDEIRRYLPESQVHDYCRTGGPASVEDLPEHGVDPADVDGVVVGGSTAGVYQADEHDWIGEEQRFIRDLVDRGVPTLGICFGHQIVNAALGGSVEYGGERHANLVDADLGDDRLFRGVDDVVPVLHSDFVTDTGDDLESIATAGYYDHFATRHVDEPVWTVQYHPEFTPRVEDQGEGWERNHLDWADCTATRTIENFAALATGDTAILDPVDGRVSTD